MHMLYHTALPTAAYSFTIAVNALLLSFSPLKMRECTGSGCVRQSISHMGGRGGCGADGSPHWVRGCMLRNLRAGG